MRAAFALALVLGCVACGTNRPDIPPELLQETGSGGGNGNYPSGPYAKNYSADIGKPIPPLEFAKGWLDPAAANQDVAALAPIAFADFYDPDGTKGNELLLLNTAAIWCSACKAEHGGTGNVPSLAERQAEFSSRGVVIFSLLFEDAQNNPAQPSNLATWAQSFDTNFPFALDPEYQMIVFGSPKTNAPLNLLIDLRTMKLLKGWTGDHPELIWPAIEDELDAREAQ
jgi:hypothetical protein